MKVCPAFYGIELLYVTGGTFGFLDHHPLTKKDKDDGFHFPFSYHLTLHSSLRFLSPGTKREK